MSCWSAPLGPARAVSASLANAIPERDDRELLHLDRPPPQTARLDAPSRARTASARRSTASTLRVARPVRQPVAPGEWGGGVAALPAVPQAYFGTPRRAARLFKAAGIRIVALGRSTPTGYLT